MGGPLGFREAFWMKTHHELKGLPLRARRSACVFGLIVLTSTAAAAQSWTRKADMPRFRQEHSGVSIGDQFIYLVGGLLDNTARVCEVDRYDTVNDEWFADYDTFPADRCRHHFNAVVYNGEIYIAGGKVSTDSTGTNMVDKWNPATNVWTPLPDLPEIHWGGPSVLHNGWLHVISGATGFSGTTTHHYRLDLEDTAAGWQSLQDIPQAVVHAAGVSWNGLIYVLGGEGAHSHPVLQQFSSVYVYDPSNNQWMQDSDMPLPRNHAEWSTFVFDDAVFSIGGVDSGVSPRGQDEVLLKENGGPWMELLPELPEVIYWSVRSRGRRNGVRRRRVGKRLVKRESPSPHLGDPDPGS